MVVGVVVWLMSGSPAAVAEQAAPSTNVFSQLVRWPSVLWEELWATAEALANLGAVRRFEVHHYTEYLAFASDGLAYWGEPFVTLLVNPNAVKNRRWDYRVEGGTEAFKARARRKTGAYQGREIEFDNHGRWSGNYPFWPWRCISSFRWFWNAGGSGVMKVYYANGQLRREMVWRDGRPMHWKEYDASGRLIEEGP